MSSRRAKVWQNLYRVFIPAKGTFVIIILISLLSAGASLVEPLIYREAINDIAGLFVQDARDNARNEISSDPTDEDPITNFFQRKLSLQDNSDQDSTATQATIVRLPHSKGHVAGRTPDQALTTLLWAVGLLLITGIIGHLLRWIGDNMNVTLSCRVEQRVIGNTFGHVLKLPLDFFTRKSSAALSKQINQQDQVFGIVNGFSQQILPEVISLVGIIAIMLTQNLYLTLIAFSILPFYFLLAVRSANKLEIGLSKYYEGWEVISTRIQDALAGIKTVKLAGAEDRETERLENQTDAVYKDYIKRTVKADRYIFLQSLLTRTSSALVLAYGGYLTLQRQLTPGDVVMFVAYLDRLYFPIDSLSALWVQLQQNFASLARAFKLTDGTVEEKRGKELSISDGRVEFCDVHFGYGKMTETLRGVSFAAEPGKITAIVGPSGAGKTTTVDLLMRLYEPGSGKILIDGQDIARCDPASVRSQIGLVATDGAIFRGTLIENIRYKRPQATEPEVMAAAVAAGLERTLERMPQGLESIIGEGGIGLSVGERQRIQIARTLVSKPRILVLDEATANLDYATEREVKNTIMEISKRQTVIIIAHRYSMVRDADQVIVMSAGEIIDQGTPDQLTASNGWFSGLVQRHMEN